jgi:hypothetical protein
MVSPSLQDDIASRRWSTERERETMITSDSANTGSAGPDHHHPPLFWNLSPNCGFFLQFSLCRTAARMAGGLRGGCRARMSNRKTAFM